MHNIITTPHRELVDEAKALAQKWHLTFQYYNTLSAEHPVALVLTCDALVLKSLSQQDMGEVKVDFASTSLAFRLKQGGGKKEPLIRAVGLHKNNNLNIIDATAGLGVDSFIMAANGGIMTLLERHPVIAALLNNGLQRASNNDSAPNWVNERMQLIHGPSIELLTHWHDERPDVIYLDPMFPHRKKSALVKKEMQLFQQLLGPDDDADQLLIPAKALALQRVVVKRPASAPNLGNCKPDHIITSKKHRFDVYLTK